MSIPTRTRIVHAVTPTATYVYGVNEKNQTVAIPSENLQGGYVPQIIGDGSDATAAIQAAIDTVAAAGGGDVVLPAGTFGITASAAAVGPSGLAHGLLLYGNVTLRGQGTGTVLKRIGSGSYHIVNMRSAEGAQIRNLRIYGQASVLTVPDAATSTLGAGILVESTTLAQTEDVTIEDVWIDDVLGYGVGVEWGHQRGLTIRNVYINGCGADGMDIKRFTANSFDAYAITLDNIRITDFGRQATDAAQTGLDIRGYTVASNIHVYGVWGDYARAGIRMRGGEAGDNSIGAQRASLTNYSVFRSSGGEADTYGVEVNAPNCSTSQGAVWGVTIGVVHFPVGVATYTENITHTGVKAFECTLYGFRANSTAHRVALIGCEANDCGTAGMRIDGDGCSIVTPAIRGTHSYHIHVGSTASGTRVLFPAYADSASVSDFFDEGTDTVRLEGNSFHIGSSSLSFRQGGTRVLEVATTAGDSRLTMQRGTGKAVLSAASDTVADSDIEIAPGGSGFHAFNNARTATTVGAAGGASALPATPTGYLRIRIGSTVRKIPYYAD